MKNVPRNDDFEKLKAEVLEGLKEKYTAETLTSDPVLAGFRELHTKVGRSNKRFVSSPENLVGMFLRNGTIPSINLIVDIYNLVSLESRLALGAHDISKIDGNVKLRITNGTEKFLPLGKTESEIIPRGEYSYVDDNNEVICRLEYRQVEKTKVTLDTRDCFFIIQGNAATSQEIVKAASQRLIDLLKQFCGMEMATPLWKWPV